MKIQSFAGAERTSFSRRLSRRYLATMGAIALLVATGLVVSDRIQASFQSGQAEIRVRATAAFGMRDTVLEEADAVSRYIERPRESYLRSFRTGSTRFSALLADLRATTSDPSDLILLDQIEGRHRTFVTHQESFITARRSADRSVVRRYAESGRIRRDELTGLLSRYLGVALTASREHDQSATLRRRLFALVMALATIALLTAAVVSLRRTTHRLAEPLERISRGVRNLAGGDTSARIDITDMDQEFAQTGQALNAIAEAMQSKSIRTDQLVDNLRQDARQDHLTGLPNRRFFDEQLAHQIAQSKQYQYGAPLCLIAIDLDHFKSVNDIYGHDAGDHVLQTFGQLAPQHLRQSDFAARVGGEEFAIICPGTDVRGGVVLIEKLRRAFGAIRFETSQGTFSMTLSAGVAEYAVGQAPADLMLAADTLLYRAKALGRNQVCTSEISGVATF